MLDTAIIAQFERRLADLGCPPGTLRRKVLEISDHHEDLKQAALEDGLNETEAAARADQLLGEPDCLASEVARMVRRSSWWGRHPLIGFCLLPPLASIFLVCLALCLDLILGRLYFPPDVFSVLADEPPDLNFLLSSLQLTSYAALAATAALFCWLARRSISGWRWVFIACSACSLYNLCVGLRIEPHSLAYGCLLPPSLPRDWIPVLLPPVVGLGCLVRQRLRTHHGFAAAGANRTYRLGLPWFVQHPAFLTPTHAALALAGVLALSALADFWHALHQQRARSEELTTQIWPAERAVVVRRLNAIPALPAARRAIPINLDPFLNAELRQSLGGPGDATGNTLATLPTGLHFFAGVPFNVQGRLQLMGGSLLNFPPHYPLHARAIPIDRLCTRFYLLHGAAGVPAELAGTNIAKLVLHYTDGSSATLPIVAGHDLLDWWGPIYQTHADAIPSQSLNPGTELAWVGTNPRLQQANPQFSLRLYRTAFDNPHPELQVASLDFDSAGTEASPFLIALSVN